jgi:hypothetical protein
MGKLSPEESDAVICGKKATRGTQGKTESPRDQTPVWSRPRHEALLRVAELKINHTAAG